MRGLGYEALTNQAIQELFRTAEVLSEGGLDDAGRWYGSIMITFDLGHLASRCRDLGSPPELARVARAIEGSVRVRIRAHRMACAEIYRRFPDRDVGTAQLYSRFSHQGDRLLLDIDLEAPVDLPSAKES